ncbi:MAG: hypothetical protein ACTS5A_01495 [Candidatus Hodgkinia cicadicola]
MLTIAAVRRRELFEKWINVWRFVQRLCRPSWLCKIVNEGRGYSDDCEALEVLLT